MDRIEITGLSLSARIGVYAWEQAINQTLLADLVLYTDLSNCAEDLAKTIDYEKLSQRIQEVIGMRAYRLIETVAEEIAKLVQQEFRIQKLSLRVSKPGALKQAKNVAVFIEREHSEASELQQKPYASSVRAMAEEECLA